MNSVRQRLRLLCLSFTLRSRTALYYSKAAALISDPAPHHTQALRAHARTHQSSSAQEKAPALAYRRGVERRELPPLHQADVEVDRRGGERFRPHLLREVDPPREQLASVPASPMPFPAGELRLSRRCETRGEGLGSTKVFLTRLCSRAGCEETWREWKGSSSSRGPFHRGPSASTSAPRNVEEEGER